MYLHKTLQSRALPPAGRIGETSWNAMSCLSNCTSTGCIFQCTAHHFDALKWNALKRNVVASEQNSSKPAGRIGQKYNVWLRQSHRYRKVQNVQCTFYRTEVKCTVLKCTTQNTSKQGGQDRPPEMQCVAQAQIVHRKVISLKIHKSQEVPKHLSLFLAPNLLSTQCIRSAKSYGIFWHFVYYVYYVYLELYILHHAVYLFHVWFCLVYVLYQGRLQWILPQAVLAVSCVLFHSTNGYI